MFDDPAHGFSQRIIIFFNENLTKRVVMDVAGKAAIVTGGASGLGRATIERYAANGAQVAIFDLIVMRSMSDTQ